MMKMSKSIQRACHCGYIPIYLGVSALSVSEVRQNKRERKSGDNDNMIEQRIGKCETNEEKRKRGTGLQKEINRQRIWCMGK